MSGVPWGDLRPLPDPVSRDVQLAYLDGARMALEAMLEDLAKVRRDASLVSIEKPGALNFVLLALREEVLSALRDIKLLMKQFKGDQDE